SSPLVECPTVQTILSSAFILLRVEINFRIHAAFAGLFVILLRLVLFIAVSIVIIVRSGLIVAIPRIVGHVLVVLGLLLYSFRRFLHKSLIINTPLICQR